MLGRKKPQKGDEKDEHNQPTEPIPFLIQPGNDAQPGSKEAPLVLPAPAVAGGVPLPGDPTFAIQNPPFPQGYPAAPYMVPGQQVYPYPIMPPLAPENQAGKQPGDGGTGEQSRSMGIGLVVVLRLLPLLIGLFFIAVQLLLLARALLGVIGRVIPYVRQETIDGLSDIFLLPVRLLLLPLHLPTTLGAEVYCVLAIPFYLLLSRLLVKTSKLLLGVKKQREGEGTNSSSRKKKKS